MRVIHLVLHEAFCFSVIIILNRPKIRMRTTGPNWNSIGMDKNRLGFSVRSWCEFFVLPRLQLCYNTSLVSIWEEQWLKRTQVQQYSSCSRVAPSGHYTLSWGDKQVFLTKDQAGQISHEHNRSMKAPDVHNSSIYAYAWTIFWVRSQSIHKRKRSCRVRLSGLIPSASR